MARRQAFTLHICHRTSSAVSYSCRRPGHTNIARSSAHSPHFTFSFLPSCVTSPLLLSPPLIFLSTSFPSFTGTYQHGTPLSLFTNPSAYLSHFPLPSSTSLLPLFLCRAQGFTANTDNNTPEDLNKSKGRPHGCRRAHTGRRTSPSYVNNTLVLTSGKKPCKNIYTFS